MHRFMITTMCRSCGQTFIRFVDWFSHEHCCPFAIPKPPCNSTTIKTPFLRGNEWIVIKADSLNGLSYGLSSFYSLRDDFNVFNLFVFFFYSALEFHFIEIIHWSCANTCALERAPMRARSCSDFDFYSIENGSIARLVFMLVFLLYKHNYFQFLIHLCLSFIPMRTYRIDSFTPFGHSDYGISSYINSQID